MTTSFQNILAGADIRGNIKIPLSKSTQFTKLSDYLQSCADCDREKLIDDVIANADNLPIATLKRMSKSLSAKAHAKEFAQSAKAQRLARLHAAMANENEDPQIDAAVKIATAELRRLGLNINASGPDGFNVAELEKKMRELNWNDERRVKLKATCFTVGVIE
jgi:hypothetical protein